MVRAAQTDARSASRNAALLLQTKLSAPPIRDDLVPRSRLTEQLSAGLMRPLVLISAPAGFGKSTLITEWRASRAGRHFPVAWLSLDDDDNEPGRFLVYVIAALGTIHSAIGDDLLDLMQSPQPPPPKSILTALINRVSDLPEDFALVMDDYHLIKTPAIHELISYLLEHIPRQMHLIITCRADPPLPLARLRVRAHLMEIRADDLRFTPDETTHFLNRMFSLRASDEEVLALGERTEGWIAGLQLAALAMQGRGDISSFIKAFTGNHRYIVDYLAEEVLNRLPEDIQNFLMQTSILERMSAPVCAAITGQQDAQDTLEYLQRGNLFIIPLDVEEHWYRYHHLFSSVLRLRLRTTQADYMAELHRRASDWFVQHGLYDEAVRHALAAPDLDRAAVIVERFSPRLEDQGDLLTLRSWLHEMPFDYVQSRPRLMIAYCWMVALMDDYNRVEGLIAGAPSLNVPDLARDIRGEVAVVRANVARWQGRNEAVIEYAREALDSLPENDVSYRSFAITNLGTALRRIGKLEASRQAFDEAVALGEAAGNRPVVMWALYMQVSLHWWQQQPQEVIKTSERVLGMYEKYEREQVLVAGLCQIFTGMMLYELNDLDGAEERASTGIEIVRLSTEQFVLMNGYICLAGIYQARGEVAAALDMIDRGEAWFSEIQIRGPSSLHLMAAQRARLWIRQGNLDAAMEWGRTLTLDSAGVGAQYVQQMNLVRLNLARNQRNYDESLLNETAVLVEELLQKLESINWTAFVIQFLSLQALTHNALGDSTRALASLTRALTLAEPRGCIRMFVDEGPPMKALLKVAYEGGIRLEYVNTLLQAFEHEEARGKMPPRSSGAASLIEPLSDRELEILGLIAEGASNRDIAAQLFISLGTVKKHVNNIFGKLDVQSRTQATAVARNLHLL